MKVSFYATLRAIVGSKTLEFPIQEGDRVLDLAQTIVDRFPALHEHVFDAQGGIARSVHIMLNGRNIRWLPEGAETVLTAEHSVDFFPPAAGG